MYHSDEMIQAMYRLQITIHAITPMPWCHAYDLVISSPKLPDYPEGQVLPTVDITVHHNEVTYEDHHKPGELYTEIHTSYMFKEL